MPRTEQETGQIVEILEGFMTESFLGDATFEMDKNTNLKSEKILKEAAAVAGSSNSQMFSSVPKNTQETTTNKFLYF